MAYIIRTNIDPSNTSGTELADIVEEVGDLTQIIVESDASNQPGGPSEGDAYIANGDASWVGGSQYDVAVFRDSTWIYHTPGEGWIAYIKDRSEYRRFNGTDWNSRIEDSSVEKATDSGTDTFVSATNTDAPQAEHLIIRDFQSENTTTTPSLDGLTITTKDGSAISTGFLSGVHTLQLNSGGTAWLLLNPYYGSQNLDTDASPTFDSVTATNTSSASTVEATTIQDKSSGDNTAMLDAIYGSAKAWVVYDQPNDTVLSSFNVDSVTDVDAGDYTVNITNDLSTTTYLAIGAANETGANFIVGPHNRTVSSFDVNVRIGSTQTDTDRITSVAVME